MTQICICHTIWLLNRKDMNSSWWLSLSFYLSMMISLISFGCNKLPYWLLCLVTPAAVFLSQAPVLCMSLLCFIDLLISPSIFFKEFTGWHLTLLSFWDFTGYGMTDCSLFSWLFFPNEQDSNHYSLLHGGMFKCIVAKYGSVDKSLSTLIKVQGGTNIWPSNCDKQLQTIFQGSPCERSLIVAPTESCFSLGI
jgi:hypothetical protein